MGKHKYFTNYKMALTLYIEMHKYCDVIGIIKDMFILMCKSIPPTIAM